MLPLMRSAAISAALASLAIAVVGLVGATVRILPWLLDPDVSGRTIAPFARTLLAVSLEAAIALGWPLGWALASLRSVESGEARVLQALGEPPHATVKRLATQGCALALTLASVALVSGSDANAPGRVASELVEAARFSCAAAPSPQSYVVPFTKLTWLCAPHREPRLVGALPGAPDVALTARAARISGDFRAVELDDARVALRGDPPISLHVSTLAIRGMAPWARASNLAPALRSLLLALSSWSSASVAVYGVLRQVVRARSGAMALGAVGPLASLGALRWLERAGAVPAAFALVPLAALGSALAAFALLPRLPLLRAFLMGRVRGEHGASPSAPQP